MLPSLPLAFPYRVMKGGYLPIPFICRQQMASLCGGVNMFIASMPAKNAARVICVCACLAGQV
jgi:hypothetical protein